MRSLSGSTGTGATLAVAFSVSLALSPSAAHADDVAPPAPAVTDRVPEIERWCAPEFEELPGAVCFHPPAKEAPGPHVLVVFLHGVIAPGTTWQFNQQRNAARIADAHGFTVIMPRGRRGGSPADAGADSDLSAAPPGPKGMEDWWVWPTGVSQQKAFEESVIAEWQAARDLVEKRTPVKFDHVWIFGFSNGGYYATSLAMRGRLVATGGPADFVADGFAAFAGGSGAPYLERAGTAMKTRPKMFVGWGGKDKAFKDQVALGGMLKRIGWPSKTLGEKNEGHSMTDKAVKEAVAFLGAGDVANTRSDGDDEAPKPVAKKPAPKTSSNGKAGAKTASASASAGAAKGASKSGSKSPSKSGASQTKSASNARKPSR